MKKLLIVLIIPVLALSVLVGCEESKKAENKIETQVTKAAEEKKDIDVPVTTKETAVEKKDIKDLVTIKEAVNKEDVSPNGDKVRYIYEVPVINIDKPGAKKINDMFLSLEKDQEKRIGNGQSMTLLIESRAFLNDGVISIVMKIRKPGPGGLYAANYDMENEKEISTKELLEKYKFDSHKLIAEINRQVKINESKPAEKRDFISVDQFVGTVITNIYPPDDYLKKLEEIQKKTKEEKERYVIDNIDKLKAYINNDGKIVFIHRAEMEDEELVVE